MFNSFNNVNPIIDNSNQNIMAPLMAYSFPNMNIMNSYGKNSPQNMNTNLNINELNNNINNMNFFTDMNIMNNQINTMNNNMNQNFNNNNINNNLMNNMNQNLNNNNMNNNAMNNMNQNFNNNLYQNLAQNMNNMDNNINQNNLINNFNNLNLNEPKETIYKEKPNYTVSEETKLILNNNQISRGKLVSNIQTISPTLQCAICLDLVMTPVECEDCSKLFCKDCIENWLKNTKECPNKHPFIKKKELDDWIKKAIGKIYLKCPYIGCGSDYAYKYWTEHVKKVLLN